jgi:SAM-dependent methyltransferase
MASLASRLWQRVRPAPAGAIAFRCNLCGTKARATLPALSRETPSCPRCGSTVRFRSIAQLVVRELLGRDEALADLAPRRDLGGIGLSDADCYARPLARVFDYRNTYFHTEPRLDITDVDRSLHGKHDFVVASDVLEHVVPPVSRAFDGALALLKPGGTFVMTVPFSLEPDTVEHYPDLHEWHVEHAGDAWSVVNRTADGRMQRFERPVFHGGPGTTLEMRLFSRDALLRAFERAGFANVRIADEPCLRFGIHWPEPWSVPMVARKAS